MIAIILGDFVHNLRSALDHIIVACSSPRSARKNAGFPISMENLWERDSRRRYSIRDVERRKSFLRAIKGLTSEAQAVVIRCQPYQRSDRASSNIFAILSRLENADKHRELITVATGIERPVVSLAVEDQLDVKPLALGRNQFLKDGAEYKLILPSVASPDTEVEVQLRGTAAISIEIAEGGGRNPQLFEFNLYRTMRTSLGSVRFVLKKLEPFVR